MVEEYEQRVDRAQAATTFRRVADGVLGGTIRVGTDEPEAVVEVPETMTLEIEYETEEDEHSFEVELEWSTDDEGEETAKSGGEDERGADEGSGGEDEPTNADAGPPETDDEPPTVPGGDELPVSAARFEVFEDRAGEWRWRLVHRNGNIIATSGEGYTRKHNAQKGLRSVVRNAPSAAIVEGDGPQE